MYCPIDQKELITKLEYRNGMLTWCSSLSNLEENFKSVEFIIGRKFEVSRNTIIGFFGK